MGNYTVQRGDTLSAIARAHGITLSELLDANPQFTQNGRSPDLIYPGENVVIPETSPASSGSPSSPTSGSAPASSGGGSTSGCTSCTISSQTVATSPSNRARTRIAVGEEVRLTVSPGPATWSLSGGGSLSPSRGSHTSVTYTAGDSAGSVTITASPSGCSCSISFTVVAPSNWTMNQQSGTNLRHQHGRPDCGWLGTLYVHPNDVNFYNIEVQEVDSLCVANGCYSAWNGTVWHGSYPLPDRVSAWIPITGHSSGAGSHWGGTDTIYSGDPGAAATGTAPSFTTGDHHFPITMQWKVGSGSANRFSVVRQEAEVFATGRCEMRKGGNTEHTMYNDPTSAH